MENEINIPESSAAGARASEVYYKKDKDFYRGMSGELRLKAEGLFKKAKEKGLSIEDISIDTIKEACVEFPGIGALELPAYLVKVVGRDINSGQTIVDGKQIDYFNIYQSYLMEKIENKNCIRDERGKPVRENNRPKLKHDMEFFLTESERFDIARKLIDDKEFGLEKTITGACDRVIRKLMGENDWLYPEEARMLEDEFNKVQEKIAASDEKNKQNLPGVQKKATERQINYLKARIKNAGVDPENDMVIRELLKNSGFESGDINELSTSDMSKVIENVNSFVPKLKETLARQNVMGSLGDDGMRSVETQNIKQ
jgi:hypothetical protein